jgi:hypothetical protein
MPLHTFGARVCWKWSMAVVFSGRGWTVICFWAWCYYDPWLFLLRPHEPFYGGYMIVVYGQVFWGTGSNCYILFSYLFEGFWSVAWCDWLCSFYKTLYEMVKHEISENVCAPHYTSMASSSDQWSYEHFWQKNALLYNLFSSKTKVISE